MKKKNDDDSNGSEKNADNTLYFMLACLAMDAKQPPFVL